MRGTLGSGIWRQSVGLLKPRDVRAIEGYGPLAGTSVFVALHNGYHMVWAWGQGGQGGFLRGPLSRMQTCGGGGGGAFVVRHIYLTAGQEIGISIAPHQADRVMPAADGSWGVNGLAGGATVITFPGGTTMTAGGGGGGTFHNPGSTLDAQAYGGVGGEPSGDYDYGWYGGAGGDAFIPLNRGTPIAYGGNACDMPFGGTPGAGTTAVDVRAVNERQAAGGGGTAGGFSRAGGGNASAGLIAFSDLSPGSNSGIGRGNPGHIVPSDTALASYIHGPGGRGVVYIQYSGEDIVL